MRRRLLTVLLFTLCLGFGVRRWRASTSRPARGRSAAAGATPTGTHHPPPPARGHDMPDQPTAGAAAATHDRPMSREDASYRMLLSFAYPAMLGAAVAWWVQALANLQDAPDARPGGWALLFGAWFIGYQCTWYWHLLLRTPIDGRRPEGYGIRSLVTDLIDIGLLAFGYGALGFAAGDYDRYHVWLVFLAVFLLAQSALVANWPRITWTGEGGWRSWVAYGAALGVPAYGALHHWLIAGNAVGWVALVLLILLYGIAWWYIRWPDWFGSARAPRRGR